MIKTKCIFVSSMMMAVMLYGCGQSAASTVTAIADTPAQVVTDTGSHSSGQDTKSINDAASIIGDIPTAQEFTDEAVDEADLNSILTAGVNAPSAMNKQPWHFSVVTDKETLQKISDDMGSGKMPGGKMPEGMKPEGKDYDGKKPEGKDWPERPEKGDFPDKPENGEFPDMPDKGSFPADGDIPTPPDGDMQAPPSGNSMNAKAGIADAPVAVIISCEDGSGFDAGLACESMTDMANVLGYSTKIISSPTMALKGDNKAEYKELLGIPEEQSAVAVLLIGHSATESDSVTGATERNPFDEVVTFVKN